ncbi:hypothetical protein OIU79_015124 [Salix purpurea]|uniref:SWIM-type domain-containing protein n=1 Tax=Salix purpurea TaxID=77065 RepID=A0A9Q0SQ50_SALPP|nr:hypothetical protein OIU79_015124 [Salix purpurea]
MESNDLMIEHNRDLLLRPDLKPGNSGNSVLDQCLGDIDDYSLNVQELGSSHIDDHRLAVNQSNQYNMVLRHGNVQNYEEKGLDFDSDVKLDTDQEHTDVDDQENQLTPISQRRLGLMEKHELANKKYCVSHENSSSAVKQNQETCLVIDTPVIQSRVQDPVPNHQLTVGQQFLDVHSCRRALRDAAIANHFELKTIKSDKTRFVAKCASEGCPWRIHAAKLPDVPTFTIRTLPNEHNCVGITHLGHQQASVQWIADSIERSLKENPHYKPKEILEEIHQAHGIALSYKQAWRAKERIMAAVHDSFVEEFHLLPWYCHQIGRTNPGSVAVVYGNPVDRSFERLFVSFKASIYGFLNACCPLIALDEMVLKGKYHGTLLLATGFDGEGAVFPFAFAVVDDESNGEWMWFLSELHNLLEANIVNMPKLTILSDRQKSIIDGIEVHFPSAFHGLCVHHLIVNFSKEFDNTILANLLWEAAFALTAIEFEQKITLIEELSEDAARWIRRIDPHLWASAYFEGKRLGHLTADIVQSLGTMILEASGLPIIQMMENIRRQLMMWFNERSETSSQWTGILVPPAERQVSVAIEHAHTHQVLKVDDAEFKVISAEGSHIVNICSRHCSCCRWQLCGLPCAHAAAALLSCRQNVSRFAESCFTVANYRKAYSQTIHPIPDKALWRELSVGLDNAGYNSAELVIKPPKSLWPPAAKPGKKRPCTEVSGHMKRAVHCSRCHQTGHFRTTCTAPL